jgi:hypothetical protein
MDWAAWGPTIVSLITCIFFAGVLWANQRSQADHLAEHDQKLEDHSKDLTQQAIKIGMLEAWKEGYAAAVARYQPAPHTTGD